MTAYKIFNLNLLCDLQLPELALQNAGSGFEYTITMQACHQNDAPQPTQRRISPISAQVSENMVHVARTENGYLLRFETEDADIILDRDCRAIRYRWGAHLTASRLRHLLLDHVIPRVLAQRGALILHGSAVLLSSGVSCCFIGTSGAGKSTLAAAFARHGLEHLADDCFMLKRIEAGYRCVPSYPGLRLWSDSAGHVAAPDLGFVPVTALGAKLRFSRAAQHHPSASDAQNPLGAIFVLDATGVVPRDRQPPTITRMPPAASVYRILRHTFNLDLKDRSHVSSQLVAVGNVATRVPVYTLAYPRLFDSLDAVIAEVKKTVNSHSSAR